MTHVTTLSTLNWKALTTTEKKEILWNNAKFAEERVRPDYRFEVENVYPLIRDLFATELAHLQELLAIEDSAKEVGDFPEHISYVQGAKDAGGHLSERFNAMEASIYNFIVKQPTPTFSVRLVYPRSIQEIEMGKDFILLLAGSTGLTVEDWRGNSSVTYTASPSVFPQVIKYLNGEMTKEQLIKRVLAN